MTLLQCRGASHEDVVQERISFQVDLQVYSRLNCYINYCLFSQLFSFRKNSGQLTPGDYACGGQYPAGKPNAVRPSFAELLEKSMCRQEERPNWCAHCRAYVSLQLVSEAF